MKKLLSLIMAVIMAVSLITYASGETVEEIVAQARTMTLEELLVKAAEESGGKRFDAIDNSGRGKSALSLFVNRLQEIDPDYTLEGTENGWQQLEGSGAYDTLATDIEGAGHIYSMTLIQDGTRLQSSMLEPGLLLNFVPKEWREAEGLSREGNENPLAFQTVNKVFIYNNLSGKKYMNMWDFVRDGETPMFTDPASDPVGRNFLYMMTAEKYAAWAREAYEAWDGRTPEMDEFIESMKADAEMLGLEGENVQYGLAWVYFWCEAYSKQPGDGEICTALVTTAEAGKCGITEYSKLRGVKETRETSVNNITVAAYQDGYIGIGGYGYREYLLIPRTSPLPWTACALIAFMTTTPEGYYAWGREIGCYAPVPACMMDHGQDGYVNGVNTYPAKNDAGYDWWTSEGKLVIEDPAYCVKVSGTMGNYIDGIISGK